MKTLLELKKALKKKMPDFKRQDSHKKKRLNPGWRKPKGSDTKVGRQWKSRPAKVKKGFRTPLKTRHLTLKGLQLSNVSKISQLQDVDPSKTVVVINGGVGRKKLLLMLADCEKRNITVVNHKLSAAKLQEQIVAEKKVKAEKITSRQQSKKAREKTAQKKKDEEKKSQEESKDEQTEKKEQDKVLTKREA
ncbi:hypothetical protein GOV04_05900 [Candidatus Woesearchaeota archaeon]|nr:hypothetical protein [Candidatus Woesearchaeota archaeon]